MVVLVRCFDNTFALALESRIAQLRNEGLICAILRKGTWIPVRQKKVRPLVPEEKRRRLTAPLAAL